MATATIIMELIQPLSRPLIDSSLENDFMNLKNSKPKLKLNFDSSRPVLGDYSFYFIIRIF